MEEKLLEIGGKNWVKNNMQRIYLDTDSVKKLIDRDQSVGYDNSKSWGKKHKTYYDLVENLFFSDKGLIRSSLNSAGFECKNPVKF